MKSMHDKCEQSNAKDTKADEVGFWVSGSVIT